MVALVQAAADAPAKISDAKQKAAALVKDSPSVGFAVELASAPALVGRLPWLSCRWRALSQRMRSRAPADLAEGIC